MPEPRYKVAFVESDAGMVALAPEWRRLYARCPDAHPYSTFEWALNSLRFGVRGCGPVVAVASCGDEIVGLAPLCQTAVLGSTVLQYLHCRPYGYVGPLVEPNHADAAAVLAEQCRRHLPGALLYCQEHSAEDLAAARLFKSYAGGTQSVDVWERPASWCIPLGGTFDTYVSRHSGASRKSLRRDERRLKAAFEVETLCLRGSEVTNDTVDRMLAIQLRSWMVPRGAVSLRLPFYREVIPAFGTAGNVEVWILQLDGKDVAYQILFLSQKRVYAHNTAFDIRYGEYSPGTMLMMFMLRDLFGRGQQEFDLLQGDGWCKRWWGERQRANYGAVAYEGGLGWLASWWPYRWQGWFARRPRLKLAVKSGLGKVQQLVGSAVEDRGRVLRRWRR